MSKPTCKDLILKVLREAAGPLAVHDIARMIFGYSENNIATRLSELARQGLVVGEFLNGEHFKRWRLADLTPGKLTYVPKTKVYGKVLNIVAGTTEGTDLIVMDVPKGTLHRGQEVRVA